MKRRVFLKGVAAGAGTLAFPAIAIGQQYKAEYKMSTVVPPAFAWGKGGEIFGNLVRERTNGRINIKQYPGSSLVQGDQTREFSAMRQGIIDVLCGAPINWSGTARDLGVFTLPFLFPDHKAWDAVTNNTAFMDEYFALVRKAGAEPLAGLGPDPVGGGFGLLPAMVALRTQPAPPSTAVRRSRAARRAPPPC